MNYPNDPPFVYARKPRISGAHVFGGGAMCMDVLMPHGWTPMTTVHALMRTIRSCFEGSIGLAADWQTPAGQVRENTEVEPSHARTQSRATLEMARARRRRAQTIWSWEPV